MDKPKQTRTRQKKDVPGLYWLMDCETGKYLQNEIGQRVILSHAAALEMAGQYLSLIPRRSTL